MWQKDLRPQSLLSVCPLPVATFLHATLSDLAHSCDTVSTLASMVFFGLIPGIMFMIGAGLVSGATIMYAMDKS